MTTSIVRTARFAILLAAGFALGMLAIATASATGGKNSLWHKMGGFGIGSGGGALADASCDVPSKDASSDIYFVSCGGFF